MPDVTGGDTTAEEGRGVFETDAGGCQKKTAATAAACVLIVVCEPDPLVRMGFVEGAAL